MPVFPTRALARALPAAALLAAVIPAAARAQNLVTNPGFETFGPTPSVVPGYTLTFSGSPTPGTNAGQFSLPGNARSGVGYFAFEDRNGATATLSQAVATTVGATYRVSFYAMRTAVVGAVNGLTVTFGGQLVFAPALVNDAYQEFSATVVADAASSTLAFTGFNQLGTTRLDDLSVTQVDAAVVPEPSTWALLAAGLAGVAGVARRRRGAVA